MSVIMHAHVCVCVCVCAHACAKCKRENTSRDLEKNGQEVV